MYNVVVMVIVISNRRHLFVTLTLEYVKNVMMMEIVQLFVMKVRVNVKNVL